MANLRRVYLPNGQYRDIAGGGSGNAVVNIERSGLTFTATREDGTTFTFTQQDNNTWQANTASQDGYVPAAGDARLLWGTDKNGNPSWTQSDVYWLLGRKTIPQNADLNTYIDLGEYVCAANTTAATITNAPSSSAFRLRVECGTTNANYIRQTVTPYNNTNHWVRTSTDGGSTWSAWIDYSLSGPSLQNNLLTTTSGTYALDAAQGPVIANMINDVDLKIDYWNASNLTLSATSIKRLVLALWNYCISNSQLGKPHVRHVIYDSMYYMAFFWPFSNNCVGVLMERGTHANTYHFYANANNINSVWVGNTHSYYGEEITLTSSFRNYSASNSPTVVMENGIVRLGGVIKPTAQIEANQETVFCTLPAVYRPPMQIVKVCQGSGMNRWTLQINTNGQCIVSRYGTTTNSAIPATAWLPFHVTWPVQRVPDT